MKLGKRIMQLSLQGKVEFKPLRKGKRCPLKSKQFQNLRFLILKTSKTPSHTKL